MSDIGLPRELAPGIHWLSDCIKFDYNGKPVHAYSSAYLVAGKDASLLVDTGHPKDWAEICRQLDVCHAKGVPTVKYIVPTHSEVPHAANLSLLLERYPDAMAYGDMRDYHLIFPEIVDRLVEMKAGDEIDLGTTKFLFLEAVVKDLVTSLWGYSTTQKCVFPGDGFAYMHHHHNGECGMVAEECPDLPFEEFTALFAEHALYWTRFTDMSRVIARLDATLSIDYPVELIAPGHGNPVTNPSVTFPRVKDGLLLGASITN
jgi:flavorubredoxin